MQDDLLQPVLILFAKSPVCGRVKTRLMPELGAQQAAQVAAAMISATVGRAAHNWPGPICLHTWPDDRHPVFASVKREHQIELEIQSGGDLGEKMFDALFRYTNRGQPAAVMGCDVPHLPGEELRRAYRLLRQGENLIGPSHDGGYYLIGLQRAHTELFEDIDWGGASVMQQTLAAAGRRGIAFKRLVSLVDIDTYEDLAVVAKTAPGLARWLI